MEEIFRQERKKQREQAKAAEATRLKQEKREAKKRHQQEEAHKQSQQKKSDPRPLPPYLMEPFGPRDAYRRLGLTEGATQDQIRKAYKRLALLYHPDKHMTKDTTALFRSIQEAYELLIPRI